MQNNEPKIIETRIPLHWIIGGIFSFAVFGAGLIWTASGNARNIENKVDQLIVSSAKLEKRIDEKDVRVESIRDRIFEMQRQVDGVSRRIDELDRMGAKR